MKTTLAYVPGAKLFAQGSDITVPTPRHIPSQPALSSSMPVCACHRSMSIPFSLLLKRPCTQLATSSVAVSSSSFPSFWSLVLCNDWLGSLLLSLSKLGARWLLLWRAWELSIVHGLLWGDLLSGLWADDVLLNSSLLGLSDSLLSLAGVVLEQAGSA